MCKLKYLPLAAALLASLGSAAEVQMQAERVALFKNGYACVQMQGKLGADSRLSIRNMPLPILGTFWWQAPVGVVRLEGREREVEIPASTTGQWELLQANAGKFAIVELADNSVCQGVISLLPAPASETGSFIAPMSSSSSASSRPSMRHIILTTAQGGSVCISSGQVRSVEFPAGENPSLPSCKITLAELDVELAAPAPEGVLRLSCLSSGLSWLPSYSLSLQDDGQAELVCKATVINDLVDLDHVELELVSGAPALAGLLVPSAVADADSVLQVIDLLGVEWQPNPGRDMMTNMAGRARVSGVMTAGLRSAPAPALDVASISRAEDLFYYTIPDFSCRRGETILRSVFALTVPYRHVYTCDVPNQNRLEGLSRSGSPIAHVFHCVRLTNKGALPWSAGVVTCSSGGRLVARTNMPFTAEEQESLLVLNKTFDASVSCREELVYRGIPLRRIERDREIPPAQASQLRRREDGTPLTASIYRGFLTLKNTSDKPMELELTKAITGTATETSDDGQIEVTPTYSANSNSRVTWKATLAAGEEKTFTYTYEFQE